MTLQPAQLVRLCILGAIDWRWLVAYLAISLVSVYVFNAKVSG